MKSFLAAVFLCIVSTVSALAQAQDSVVQTSPMADSGRFEYIRSPKDRITFRLDKYSGKIHRLTTCPRDDSEGSSLCLKEMTIVEPVKGPYSSRVRFQIYIDTLTKMTLLFDLETGRGWQWGLDPYEKWHPFLECNDRVVNACLWRP